MCSIWIVPNARGGIEAEIYIFLYNWKIVFAQGGGDA